MREGKRKSRTWLWVILALLIGIGMGVYGDIRYRAPKKEPELTSAFVSGKLEAVSELTTARLTYTGLIKYSEGKIPFLTQNSFSMIYTAKVRAGVDLARAGIEIGEAQVVITLPECEVQSIDIDEQSIEFYDEHWALFNRTEKEDVIDTIAAAKEDVQQNADLESLLESAGQQTRQLIKGLLEDEIGERELVIQQ
ncbi:MAG: DUF4230 domain-containing protein [Lachnospiraceae bacterium]|nr:DUF4230 domain-containing protein [Lachnospiraceae bacterium]